MTLRKIGAIELPLNGNQRFGHTRVDEIEDLETRDFGALLRCRRFADGIIGLGHRRHGIAHHSHTELRRHLLVARQAFGNRL